MEGNNCESIRRWEEFNEVQSLAFQSECLTQRLKKENSPNYEASKELTDRLYSLKSKMIISMSVGGANDKAY